MAQNTRVTSAATILSDILFKKKKKKHRKKNGPLAKYSHVFFLFKHNLTWLQLRVCYWSLEYIQCIDWYTCMIYIVCICTIQLILAVFIILTLIWFYSGASCMQLIIMMLLYMLIWLILHISIYSMHINRLNSQL